MSLPTETGNKVDPLTMLSTQVAVLDTKLGMFMGTQEKRIQNLEAWRASGSQRFTGIIAVIIAGAALLLNFAGAK